MCFVCHVLTVFIVEAALVIADSSNFNLIIVLQPKEHQSNSHAKKGLTYRPSKLVDDHDTKNSSDAANTDLLRVLGDDNYDYFGDDKIVGGSDTEITLYPHHVRYGYNCAGVIIDKNWVITVGHCGNREFIKYGSKYINLGTKINVKANFVHPMWVASDKEHPFDYDFQLLQLEEPIKLGENAKPIQLGRIEDMVIGTVVTVTGWGHTQEKGQYSHVLQAVRVPIVAKESCQDVKFPYFRGKLTPRMFCAGYFEGKKDACQGDSGGPAVANGRLLGLVSFGYGCATPGSYGVYSKIYKVRNWIEQTTGLHFT